MEGTAKEERVLTTLKTTPVPTLLDFLILLHNSGLVNLKLLVKNFFRSLTGYSYVHGMNSRTKKSWRFCFPWFSWREACLVLIEAPHAKFYCSTMQVTHLV